MIRGKSVVVTGSTSGMGLAVARALAAEGANVTPDPRWWAIEARANAAGQSFDEAKQEFVAEKQPMPRYTRPEDIGELAVFLFGDAAAAITGACYSIDGGWTAQ